MQAKSKARLKASVLACAGALGGMVLFIALIVFMPAPLKYSLWSPGNCLANALIHFPPFGALIHWLAPEGGPAAYIAVTTLSSLIFWGSVSGMLSYWCYVRRQRQP